MRALKINSKGFTLFTALVAFILILLSILLVQSMVSSERKTTDLVSDIEEQTKMQSIAELNRTDALQAFNYLIRKRIEGWLTSGENNYYTMTPDKAQDWNQIVKDFAAYEFGGVERSDSTSTSQLASFIYLSINGFFEQKNVSGYQVTLRTKDPAKLQLSIKKAIEESSKKNDFFKVIGCGPEDDPKPETCVGTFYLNLDFSDSSISQDEYEALPVIEVANTSSGAVIQQPVLPRGKMQIYVPLRIFKALAWARKIACNTGQCSGTGDYGFLSARVHNELEEIALGYCDKGFCAPRTDPYSNPKLDGFVDESGSTMMCGSNQQGQQSRVDVECSENVYNALGATGTCPRPNGNSGISYLANKPSNAMADFGKARLCSIAKSGSNEYVSPGYVSNNFGADFRLSPNSGDDCSNSLVYAFTASAGEYPSKRLYPAKGFDSYDNIALVPGMGAGQYQPHGYSERSPAYNFDSCPVQPFSPGGTGLAGGIGLFLGADGKKNDYATIKEEQLACTGVGTGPSLQCGKIDEIKITLNFTDTNSLYMVDKTRASNSYSVMLFDNRFNGFSARWSAPKGANCLLQGPPRDIGCSDYDGWSCIPLIKVGTGAPGTGSNKSGCKPT